MANKTKIDLADYEWGLADMFDEAMHAEAGRKNEQFNQRRTTRDAAATTTESWYSEPLPSEGSFPHNSL